MILLIGSRALDAYGYTDYPKGFRNVQDWDIICTKAEFSSLVKSVSSQLKFKSLEYKEGTNKAVVKFNGSDGVVIIEASLIDVEGGLSVSDKQIYEKSKEEICPLKEVFYSNVFQVVSISLNYILKYSHRFKKDSPHFEKTWYDLQWYKKKWGEKAVGHTRFLNQDLLEQREKLTYTNKTPVLAQGKSTFFTDNVKYIYDHDSIHRAVAIGDKPAYLEYIKDNQEVMCDKAKWDAASYKTKLNGVLEECYVLALERAIIPYGVPSNEAFKKALEKVCTSITSGWFREWAWENYDNILEAYSPEFFYKFWDAKAKGEILPYKGRKY